MRRFIYTCLVMMLLPLMMCGQSLRGSYFFDSSIQRVKLNPAFAPKTNFINVPLIGDLSVNVNSNIGVSNFLFPKGGELYTYLNTNVSTAEFKALLPANPSMKFGLDVDLLGAGFYISEDEYLTIDIGVKVDARMDVPQDLFVFLKDGAAQSTYNFKNFHITQNGYTQLSVGYRRDMDDLVPGLSIGAKIKLLEGIDRIDMKINDAQLTMGQDKWILANDAEGVIYGKGLKYTEASGDKNLPSIQLNPSSLGIAGWGFAVDLGAEYKLDLDTPVLDGINFSASVTDLGTIFYSGKNAIKLQSKASASFEGFKDINAQFDLNESVNKLVADFMALANFEEVPGAAGGGAALTPKAFIGVEAPMLENLMSVGLLYSYMYGVSDITASYNLKVKDRFNVGVNYSFLNTAKTIGFLLEFVPRNGVSIYFGTDYLNFSYIPQGLPVDKVIMNAKFGLHATFGSKYYKY